jgi:hypothetical protein
MNSTVLKIPKVLRSCDPDAQRQLLYAGEPDDTCFNGGNPRNAVSLQRTGSTFRSDAERGRNISHFERKNQGLKASPPEGERNGSGVFYTRRTHVNNYEFIV